MPGFKLNLESGQGGASIPLGSAQTFGAEQSIEATSSIEATVPVTMKPSIPAGLRAWISLKASGDMGNSAQRNHPNRLRYLQSLGIRDQLHVFACRQVHSRRVVVIENQDARRIADEEADGLITNHPDAILTVTVADCLPIYLLDSDHGAYALLHSGWRGTGIVTVALERMAEEYGTRPDQVTASIGPGIGSCCYRVEQRRYRAFQDQYGTASGRKRDGFFYLDLAAVNSQALREWGVQDVRVCSDCTACTPQLASYRRDGPGFSHMLAGIGVIDDD